jgi:hypothetical protein
MKLHVLLCTLFHILQTTPTSFFSSFSPSLYHHRQCVRDLVSQHMDLSDIIFCHLMSVKSSSTSVLLCSPKIPCAYFKWILPLAVFQGLSSLLLNLLVSYLVFFLLSGLIILFLLRY